MNIKGTHVVPFFIPLEDMTNFAVYTKNGCPYCSKIKQILDAKGFTYQEYKLDVDFNRESFYDAFGRGSTFPQVLLNSEKIGGCTDSIKLLRERKLI